MTNAIRQKIAQLASMRLPELQACYAEVVGEPTRAPNKTYLIRRITEALEARIANGEEVDPDVACAAEQGEEALSDSRSSGEAPRQTAAKIGTSGNVRRIVPAKRRGTPDQQNPDNGTAADNGVSVKLSKLPIDELQARYLAVVGRPTGSSHRGYLLWKIRQAERGKIPVGPLESRRVPGEAQDMKILPLRMSAKAVEALDAVWRRRGLRSRMDLFRSALRHYLVDRGEQDAANHFLPPAP